LPISSSKVIAVGLRGGERAARAVGDAGPECAVGIDRLFELAVHLRVVKRGDLRAVHGEVDALGRRQAGGLDRVELFQDAGPVDAARFLRRRVDPGKAAAGVRGVVIALEFFGNTPLPFPGVDGLEARIGWRRFG
jgi:hypothetical protein